MTDDRHRGTGNRYGTPAGKGNSQAQPGGRSPGSSESASSVTNGRLASSGAQQSGWRTIGRQGKSVLLGILDRLPFKPVSKYSTALLRHYVEGSGDPVSLSEIPQTWKDMIIRKTHGRVGHFKDISSYDVGLYDMQNSLGHFDVDVVSMGGGEKQFKISDEYKFGFKKGDRRARHGFPLGDLSERSLSVIKAMLPSDTYRNPGGFEERWEVKRLGGEHILFIPQSFLAEQGVPFEVFAQFRQ